MDQEQQPFLMQQDRQQNAKPCMDKVEIAKLGILLALNDLTADLDGFW